jgi:hypothetical protein
VYFGWFTDDATDAFVEINQQMHPA